jgi:hypothetical protein
MAIDVSQLDQMQSKYKSAVETWISAIRQEEALASVNHSVAQVDQWENASQLEEEARKNAKTTKKDYEDALRKEFFNF